VTVFSKFLSRLSQTRRAPHTQAVSGDLEARVSKTIEDALASAGLLRGPSQKAPEVKLRRPPAAERRHTRDLPPEILLPGSFGEDSFTNHAGTRRYKLYVPRQYDAERAVAYPLVVMLHGCTQSPDDFAAGTRMNALADRLGFLVAYPAQSPNANGSKCWNWFRPGDQAREAGEPALLAGLTRQLIARYAVDPRRVYVAGLSAGAAMAVILGATYPELYAAVGAHSGLPYRAANDVPTAFAAMGGTHARREVAADARTPQSTQARGSITPLIVFHGDADRTVASANGRALVEQALGAASALLPESLVTGTADAGRTYTRSVYTTALGAPLVEYWQIHGAGHAWSGGDASGTYSDPEGPDASTEMMRFFLQTALPADLSA
jgi:poly(hydroxyalkanoate) depolymerase family esterase